MVNRECLFLSSIVRIRYRKDFLIILNHSPMHSISDKEAPELTCPNRVFAETDVGLATAMNVTIEISVYDNEDDMPDLECSYPTDEDYAFLHGDTLVNCNATDRSGNAANCSFYVTVIGRFSVQYSVARPKRQITYM